MSYRDIAPDRDRHDGSPTRFTRVQPVRHEEASFRSLRFEANYEYDGEDTSSSGSEEVSRGTLSSKLALGATSSLILAAVGVASLAVNNHQTCQAEGQGLSCSFNPRKMMENSRALFCRGEGQVFCGNLCLPAEEGSFCCPGPSGAGILCAEGDMCCDGVCFSSGTGCDERCNPGLIFCGGLCVVGTDEDTCCLGPEGKGVVCRNDDQCCSGLCVAKGTGCAEVCAPGLMKCGSQCLAAEEHDSSCCLGPSGDGIVCGEDAECCGGVCLTEGTPCTLEGGMQFREAEGILECSPGMVPCGGVCMVGDPEDVCCIGPSGYGLVCGKHAVCCDGVCARNGTTCDPDCNEGLISCGGTCLAGAASDECCVGPDGRGILCHEGAECCHGVCMAKGTGCAEECAEGFVKCGGQCIAGKDDDTCCLSPTGAGIMCDAGSICCDGVCVLEGEGCSEICREGLFRCGGQCVPGIEGTDTCCHGPLGTTACYWPDRCCDGECRTQGTGCATPCSRGMVSCGGECLVGVDTDLCCIGSTGHGIVCGADAECCSGLCVGKGFGCAEECGPDLMRCGGECLVGNEDAGDICCEGPSGGGIVCDKDSTCCGGACVIKGQGCSETCAAGHIKCGGQCLPGDEGATCCEGPSGSGVLCSEGSECCGGLCQAYGAPCALEGPRGQMPGRIVE